MSTTQTAEDLSDDLGEYAIETEDGSVRATVTEITSHRKASDDLTLVAELPDGITVSETFSKPRVWNETNKFVRIVRSQGYDASSLHFLKGEKLPVEKNRDDEWQFRDPGTYAPRGSFDVAKIQGFGIVGWVSVGVLGWLLFGGYSAYAPPAVAAICIFEILTAMSE
jgi:hypothetical protein